MSTVPPSGDSGRYSRRIMTREDDLNGMFDLRESLADNDFDSWIGEAA